MIDKIVQSMADAMAGIKDGSTVLVGGFGAVGQPNALIDGLIEQGATDLVVACNNAGVGHVGLARLMELGRVRKIICSFPRSSDPIVFEPCNRKSTFSSLAGITTDSFMRRPGADGARRSPR